MATVCLKSGETVKPELHAEDGLVILRMGGEQEIVMLPGDALELGHEFLETAIKAVTKRGEGHDQ